MKKFVAAAAFFALAVPSLAGATTWDIDPVHTYAGFSVKHMMVSNVKGEFGKVTGTVTIDDKDVTKSVVDVTIDATSIDTRNADRDAHLKKPEFFDVEKHPNLTFKSTKVEKGAKGKLKVTGDLTMRGVSKPVVLDVDWPGTEITLAKEMGGGTKTGGSATTKINRQDFGISYNTTLDKGGLAIGNDVAITLEIELNKRTDDKKAGTN